MAGRDHLLAQVTIALQLADDLELDDVGIWLDRARVSLEEVGSQTETAEALLPMVLWSTQIH